MSNGNYYSAVPRVSFAVASYALGRIPYLSPALKFGIPLWDAFYREEFHRSVQRRFGNNYKE